MREIKFRGWNSKHNKRIYGDLFRNRGEWFITQDGIVTSPLAEPEDWRVEPEDWRVEPESIGQCIGLLDKNGQEIYEGDILESTRPAKERYLVVRDEEDTAFYAKDLIFESRWKIPKNGECVVIGNIYKNPDMIPT